MAGEVLDILEEMKALHLKKSAGYGSDQDPLHNFNAVAKGAGMKNYYYPILRCMEKLTRAANLYAAGRDDELEEEFKDVALLMVLAEAMRRQAKANKVSIPAADLKHSVKLHVGVTTPSDIDHLVEAIVSKNQKSLDFIDSPKGQEWRERFAKYFDPPVEPEPHVMVDAFKRNVIVDDLPEDDETDLPTRNRVEKEANKVSYPLGKPERVCICDHDINGSHSIACMNWRANE